ncbi:CoA-transferase family III [Neurospora crassa]|uniref:Alpha-methylacyl-CoA racemase n=1 Tax=Neurospora crassa (strain ATCC 24698 / 74-OR23-1A / CBS 708.71 / DSM 1257 / FGSC 987) TaxID=367110 RepID=Q7RWS0_NEUCR|nr:alpha-methylacyl-CoA racemase [Neurospora crassa OR74A]EAA26927.1 alpha-methylacyl-CoA racemase [Neurospora crassa OR74A]KHE79570.1 CoA-transferase family III [Neurospora crassa]|eukprot:XP_956163.1 alpha-methylacyl-CoA racemase [Neurospora crassa OR74A]
MASSATRPYSVAAGASEAFGELLKQCKGQVPKEFGSYSGNVTFVPSNHGDQVYFPSPCREQDAIAAIKALEACAAAAIGDLRHGKNSRSIKVDLDKAACFLMSAYLATIDGKRKGQTPKGLIPDTDFNQAQSIQYRRLSANLYETKEDGRYYHIHGSLDATTQLRMIGLLPFNPRLTDYQKCIDTIEAAVKRFTVAELEDMNSKHGQAGVEALKWENFLETTHGKVISALPPFTVEAIKVQQTTVPETPPHTPTETKFQSHLWPKVPANVSQYALRGIKVIEMCRVIAGPTIGRSLAAHGAQVLKVTGPKLPDVPFFQVDVNTGKHTSHLDLRNQSDLKTFQNLLAEADVLIDGYRPGALAKFGCDPQSLAKLAQQRGNHGFVYVAEDCFGGTGVPGAEWAGRRGWQQIADCVTGVAWAQGQFMGLENEPSVPPMPMSDYGTGALGCVAAMAGLYQRETKGGSWMCRTSLCQYDIFLLKLGLLPLQEQERLKMVFAGPFFKLRHYDSVDKVSGEALKAMQRAYPHLFGPDLMLKAKSKGFNGKDIRWPKEAIEVEGLLIQHVRASRPNGFDRPGWEGWETDLIMDGEVNLAEDDAVFTNTSVTPAPREEQHQQQAGSGSMNSVPQRRNRIATMNTVLATA